MMVADKMELCLKEIREIVGESNVETHVPLKQYTSFRIGGPADIMAFPSDIESLTRLIQYLSRNQINRLLLGNGTNLLVSDKGFRGVVIHTGKHLKSIAVKEEENRIYAQCGASLAAVSAAALKHGLRGLEFASGIPGTMGGALFMNAGAYGSTMSDVVESTIALDEQGGLCTIRKEEHDFGYRNSCFRKKCLFVLETELKLEPGNYNEIRDKMNELNMKRKTCQPLEYPSAGSVFKRPEGCFAGNLIEDSGLKGYTIGGACVSEKHAGFIINKGSATADDVNRLINHIISVVYDRFHVTLEPEIIRIGEF
ncbi:MAG: UDP-N-acetylmuramate dehydrogenase [Clostridia bacterium]|jgi:UDP-N-acetylmuramate dehydrogenase